MDDEPAEREPDGAPGASAPPPPAGSGPSAPPPPPPPTPALPPPPTVGWVLPTELPRPTIQIGSVLGRSFDTFGREWSLFLVLAGPAGLGALLQSLLTGPASSASSDAQLTLNDLPSLIGATLLGGLFTLVSTVAITHAADALWQGRQIGVGDAFAGGLRALPRYVGVMIVLGLVVGGVALLGALVLVVLVAGLGRGAIVIGAIALLAAVPLMLYLTARLALLAPVVVLEHHGVLGSISRAWDLSRDHALVLFLLSLVVGIASALPLWGGSLFAGFVSDPVIAGVALAIATLVFEPLPSIAMLLAWGDRIGGRHADSPVMARGQGRAVAALLVFGLGAILFVAGFGVAAQATSGLTSLR